MNILYKKKFQNLPTLIQNKLFKNIDKLWNFFLNFLKIFLFWSIDTIFSTLAKTTLRIFKLKKDLV